MLLKHFLHLIGVDSSLRKLVDTGIPSGSVDGDYTAFLTKGYNMNLRKLGFVLGSSLLSLPVLAEGESSTSSWDFSFLGDAATDMASQFKDVMTGDVATACYTVLGVLIGFYLLLKLPRFFGLGKK